MKSSFKKLRDAIHKHDHVDQRGQHPSSQLDELDQAAQDMEDMKNCYDSLLQAAAATANSAYEFSESLRDMGSCLLEKTALNEDESSGRVLLMLGKVQFDLQKLVDKYRSHIFQTITTPSESLLSELRTVEDVVSRKQIGHGFDRGKLYYFSTKQQPVSNVVGVSFLSTAMHWHSWLGHHNLNKLKSSVPSTGNISHLNCETFCLSKHRRESSPFQSLANSSQPFDLVHLDV